MSETVARGRLTKNVGLFLGPLLFLSLLLFQVAPDQPGASRMAAVAVWMAVWWVTEAVPLAATALLPLMLFPLLGILKGKDTAPVYINSTIFLFIGGFMIALAMERWKLHRRIAFKIITWVGGGPARMTLGFMLAASFLSMWISNTATAIMMLPIGLAIIREMERDFGVDETRKLSVGLMLAIAYGCSIGGIATLVGTPPNLSFARIFEITFPDAVPISFGQWMTLGLPLTLGFLGIIWLLLTRVFFRAPSHLVIDPEILKREARDLGPMGYEERVVAVVFAITALLWVFRKSLVLGPLTLPGWSQLLPYPGFIDDGTVALTMAGLLFIIPARAKGERIMAPSVFNDLPWHIVLLFGGGFALAKGFRESGLAELVGRQFTSLEGSPPLMIIGSLCLGLTFLTELTSNTATTEMILPILASMAVAMKTNPLMLMVPATLSASCAFMMPVATPPNAIIFGSGKITVAEMARVGLVINLIGIVWITLYFYLVGFHILGIDPSVMPTWAEMPVAE